MTLVVSRPWRVALAMGALAVAARVGAIAAWPDLRPMTFEYEGIADNILAGRGFRFPHLGLEYLSMRPLFVYLCVAVYSLTEHSHLAMLLVQALVSGLAVVVVSLIGDRLGQAGVASIAGLLTALEPGLVYYDVTRIHPLGLQVLLLSLVVLAFLVVLDSPDVPHALIAGIATGAAFYERGTPALFAPAGLALVVRWRRVPIRRSLALGLALGLGGVLVLAPWVVRNYQVYGKPVLVMTAGPELLWIGNNYHATGTLTLDSGIPMVNAAPEEFRARLAAADELTQQQLFRDDVVRFFTTEPLLTLKLFVKKLFYFWWFSPQSGREHPAWAFMLYRPLYLAALLVAVWGLVVGLRGEAAEALALILVFLVAISIGQSLFFVEGRHRLAVIPLLLLFASVGGVDLARRARRRLRSRPQ